MENNISIEPLTIELVSKLVDSDIYLNDEIVNEVELFLNHLITDHKIYDYNVKRLIEGFQPYIIEHKINDKEQCNYHSDLNTSIRCILSYNYGTFKKWNIVKDKKIQVNTLKIVSSAILRFINGLTDNSTLISLIAHKLKSKALKIVNGRHKLTRISTQHQMNVLENLNSSEEKFDYLIASMNKQPKKIIDYLESVFTHEQITEIVITAIKGKSKVATILFRVPLVAQTIIRLFMENADKDIYAYNNSQLIRIDLLQLISLYQEGLLHTRKEKIDAYVTKLSYKKGHLTQLGIFAFGLMKLSPIQIIKEIELANKVLPTLEEIDKSNKSAKLRIIDYKDSFMMTEKAIRIYKDRCDVFYQLLREYVIDNKDQIREIEIDCDHRELTKSAKFNEMVLKCFNYEVCEYSTK